MPVKVGLLADIHGNADALDVVLAAATANHVDRLLVAGDLIGYYYEAGRVLDLLNDWEWDAVGGNHEEMLRRWETGTDREKIQAAYGSALSVSLDELSADQRHMLKGLPDARDLSIDGRRVRLCHGSPWDRDTYVYPDAKDTVRSRFGDAEIDLVVFGHTHYPVSWNADGTLVVNPGSVGQPRDRIPGACWALWATDSNSVEFKRETYDPAKVIAACRCHDPNLPYLENVLTRRT